MKEKFIDDIEKFISKHPYYKDKGISLNRSSVYGIMGQINVEFDDNKASQNSLLIQF